jgi:hypothetical protein
MHCGYKSLCIGGVLASISLAAPAESRKREPQGEFPFGPGPLPGLPGFAFGFPGQQQAGGPPNTGPSGAGLPGAFPGIEHQQSLPPYP